MKVKIGIFFGGPSRARELSFAGGRLVYENLDRSLFEPVPIFVNSMRQFILLDWKHLYAGALRDVVPPVETLPPSANGFQIYEESLGVLPPEDYDQVFHRLGQRIEPAELPRLINLAFLTLLGTYGEDGQIQSHLDALRIPYTGSGSLVSKYNFEEALQRGVFREKGIAHSPYWTLSRQEWLTGMADQYYQQASKTLGFPLVIRPSGEDHAVAPIRVDAAAGLEGFREAIDAAFFREIIPVDSWLKKGEYDRLDHIRLLGDLRAGLGFPIHVFVGSEHATIHHPEELLKYLTAKAAEAEEAQQDFFLESGLRTEAVVLESWQAGEAFTAVALRRDDLSVHVLPILTDPIRSREVLHLGEANDDIPEYLAAELPEDQVAKVQQACGQLFASMGIQAFGLAEGKINAKGEVIFERVHTNFPLSLDSPLFRAAAAIGLSPAQLLTYLIRVSLRERVQERPDEVSYRALLTYLDDMLQSARESLERPAAVGILLGGAGPDWDTSLDSARCIYQELSGTGKYLPLPIFVKADDQRIQLFPIPIDLFISGTTNSIPQEIESAASRVSLIARQSDHEPVTGRFAQAPVLPHAPASVEHFRSLVCSMIIAFDTFPANGPLQRELEWQGIPFTGPSAAPVAVAADRYQSLYVLGRNGMVNASRQFLARQADFLANPEAFRLELESKFAYPLLGRTTTRGELNDTRILFSREELNAYLRLCFRPAGAEGTEYRKTLRLKPREHFPIRNEILFQEIVRPLGAKNFLPLRIGVIPHLDAEAHVQYQVLPPSERLKDWYQLSASMKPVVGDHHFLTPARLGNTAQEYTVLAGNIEAIVQRVARILNLEGIAVVDLAVRVFSDDSMNVLVEEVHPVADWAPGGALVQQILREGLTPHVVLEQYIKFTQERQQLRALQKEAQAEHLFAHQTPVVMSSTPESEPFEPTPKPEQTPKPVPETAPRKKRQLPELPATGITGLFLEALANIWYFLSSAFFLKNLLAAAIMIIVLFLVTNIGLKIYTSHGQSVEVQDYRGMGLQEARRKARSRSFDVVINDSVYIVGKAPNVVLEQTPKPGARIKRNRNIYLTISSGDAPLVPLPDLIGGNDDFDQYKRKLDRLGITARIKEREFNAELEDNTILYLVYNNQRITARDLKRGVEVPKGSTVDFVVSIRNTGTVPIPDLVCKTYEEASFLITSSQLAIGQIFMPGDSPGGLYVYKQEPAFAPGQMLNVGELINLYLTESPPVGCAEKNQEQQ